MRFVPYSQISSRPNIIVDGAATHRTILTLSHWPKSGTPAGLRGDTSAEIVFNYLDDARSRVDADVVSNNHFDEDGLIGIFSMVEPSIASRHRDLLIDAAKAGDFGVYATRDGARLAMTIGAYADRASSPLSQEIFLMPYHDQAAALYGELLKVLPHWLGGPRGSGSTGLNAFRNLWETEDARLTASEAALDNGIITLEEHREIELAIARIPEGHPDCHPYALHTRTPCNRLLVIHGASVEFRYRYESWVQFSSRPVLPRVDLSVLSEELNQAERSNGRWVFEGVDQITPGLRLEGAPGTTIPADKIVALIEHHLRTGRPAWNPYN